MIYRIMSSSIIVSDFRRSLETSRMTGKLFTTIESHESVTISTVVVNSEFLTV